MADENPTSHLTVTIRLFARARDLAGTAELTVELPAQASLGDARRELLKRCPGLQLTGARLLAAVGTAYAADTQPLVDGDEIAFFPPVSGG